MTIITKDRRREPIFLSLLVNGSNASIVYWSIVRDLFECFKLKSFYFVLWMKEVLNFSVYVIQQTYIV